MAAAGLEQAARGASETVIVVVARGWSSVGNALRSGEGEGREDDYAEEVHLDCSLAKSQSIESSGG